MNEFKQKQAAKKFVEKWKGKGYEKGETQMFWITLLCDVYGVQDPESYIYFEDQVHLDNTSFIDARIPQAKVLIEQKSLGKNLRAPIKQSDGTFLTPFQQAKRYIMELPVSQHPRWVVTCNFSSFLIYDMEQPAGLPQEIMLENLPEVYYKLQFLVDPNSITTGGDGSGGGIDKKLSIQAGEIVGKIYDAFFNQYHDKSSKHTLHSLNVLCVRLVFCLYAENSGLFGHYGIFYEYLSSFKTNEMRKALVELFKILDTAEDERDPYLKDDNPKLAAFPYVNGGLFSDGDIEIPPFTEEIRDLLLEQASAGFNWSGISPTIFGAVFESTLNPETRRSGGMHYTSIENIHKVIDPLFLNDLTKEFNEICENTVERTRNTNLQRFQTKLASLTFLDPACGSGNFLTETYLSLRRLENKIIHELKAGQISFEDCSTNLIQVNLGQFYGIEINDFAVTVAKTALWIAESQMKRETEEVALIQLDFFPLKSYTNIKEDNALRIDWNDVIPSKNLSYIIGNPPFVGYKFQTSSQKDDLKDIAFDFESYGTLDYVSGWYIKATKYIKGTNCRCALVSTNSVSQGEHVNTLWKPLFEIGLKIIFAYRTFRWDSEVKSKAAVHCVIIGFTCGDEPKLKFLWNESGLLSVVNHINGYLLDAPDIFIEKRLAPLSPNVPIATKGNAAMDNGYLILSPEERDEILSKEPQLNSVIRRHMSADDFIDAREEYCFWLKDASPELIKNSHTIQTRIRLVQDYRNNSNRLATKRMAAYPALFAEVRQPVTNYIMLPVVSSEKRRYVPIAFLSPDIINSYASISIPNASLYHFGVLCSNVHMAWMRFVCGRLEMRYRYSTTGVYNNFPWPTPTKEQKQRVEESAQAILDARAKFPNSSLATLYDDFSMPKELRKAHQENDKAVMAAYGWGSKDEPFKSEEACVTELLKLYQQLTHKS